MSNIAVQISESQARYLAINNLEAYANDTPNPDDYYTYPEVAGANFAFGTYGAPFVMSGTLNNLTGQLSHSSGSFPINKSKKMFPR